MIRLQNWLMAASLTILAVSMSACGSTKLLDIEKTSDALNLSAYQRAAAQLKIEKIRELVEDYELEKQTLESELKERRSRMRGMGIGGGMHGGNRGDMRSKLQAFNAQWQAFQEQIDKLVSELQESLDADQLEKFSEIELPKLNALEFGGGRGFGGGGRRRGGGGAGFGGFGG